MKFKLSQFKCENMLKFQTLHFIDVSKSLSFQTHEMIDDQVQFFYNASVKLFEVFQCLN